jgi:WD40 repeat protein
MPGAQPIFSPDGAWLAGVREDSLRVVVWDFEKSLAAGSGQLLFELPGHKSLIFAMAFSPDGTRLASAGLDGTAILWSLGEEGGEALITLSGHMRAIADVDFSLDGARLATGADDGVRIWDLSASGTAELLAFPGHGDLVSEVDISQDGKYLATASMDGTAKVWDLTDGQLLFDLLGHTDRVVDVSFSPDGRLLATAGTDNTARTWDFAASLSAGAGQPLLALSGHRDAPPIGGLFPGVSRVNFSPDGQLLVTAGADGTARVWEVHSGREVLVLSGHPNGNGVTNAIFSPDGTRLATATDSSRIADTVVKVWDFSAALKTGTGTGRDLLSLSGFPDRVWGLAFSPDGRRLATSTDYVAEVWDLDTGLKNFTLSGHTSTVIDIKFSPDGSLLATAGGDGTTKLWEAATGQELFTFTNVSGLLNRVDFTPDSKYLAISGPDWVVRLYAVELEQLVALAKSRVTRSLTTEECRLFLHLDQCPSEP